MSRLSKFKSCIKYFLAAVELCLLLGSLCARLSVNAEKEISETSSEQMEQDSASEANSKVDAEEETKYVPDRTCDEGLVPYYGDIYSPAGGAFWISGLMGLKTPDGETVVSPMYTGITETEDSYGYPMYYCINVRRHYLSYMVCAKDGSWSHYFEDQAGIDYVNIDDDHLLHIDDKVYKVGRELTYVRTDSEENLYTDDRLFAAQDKDTGLYGFQDRDGNWKIQPEYVEAGSGLVVKNQEGEACLLNEDGTIRFFKENGSFSPVDYVENLNSVEFLQFTSDDSRETCWVQVSTGKEFSSDMENDGEYLYKWEDGILTYVKKGSSKTNQLELGSDYTNVGFSGEYEWSAVDSCSEFYWGDQDLIYAEKGQKRYLFDLRSGEKFLSGDYIEYIAGTSDTVTDYYYSVLNDNQLRLYDYKGKYICDLDGAAVLGIIDRKVYSVSKVYGVPYEAYDLEDNEVVRVEEYDLEGLEI